MFARVMIAASAALLGVAAQPALAAPVCGNTPRIAELARDWAEPAGRVMIAAHRGGHLRAPENSLAAVDEAVAAGADFIEFDVQVSSDGVPFVMHDRTVDRTTDGHGKSAEMTYAALRKLRLKGGDTPPPTLVEMLRHTCGRILVDLDMKTDQFVPVLAIVQSLGMVDQVMMFDADTDLLRAAQAIEPNLSVMPRLNRAATLPGIIGGVALVRIVHGDLETLVPANRDAIRALPARIWANALDEADALMKVNSPSTCKAIDRLRTMGTNTIQTDYPALLRETLARCPKAG